MIWSVGTKRLCKTINTVKISASDLEHSLRVAIFD